jgi:DNA-binding response OmpR family regulator
MRAEHKQVLLIEDNLDWRQIAASALEAAGYSVIAVSGAAEALLQADDLKLALIILDLDLGGENGLMLMKHLKRHHQGVAILICTGMDPAEPAVQRMRELGADHFLRKGTMSELISAANLAATRTHREAHSASPSPHS